MSLGSRLGSALRSAVRNPAVRRGARKLTRAAVRAAQQQGSTRTTGRPESGPVPTGGPPGKDGGPPGAEGSPPRATESADALADRTGPAPLALDYAPREDGHPDPGEVVWAWVPFEEDLTRGKDRPVLVIAEEDASVGGVDGSGPVLVALMLTSRDRTEEGGVSTDEHGATWVDIGAGGWDRRGRPSEARADRLLRLAPHAVRREGGRLDRARFARVAAAVQQVSSR